MHTENHPHKYAISWTTSRKLPPGIEDIDAGGHFFFASHGVRVQAAANTVIVWQPKRFHGTSLHHTRNPDKISSQFYYQRGLAFVDSSRLLDVWKAYKKKEISHEQSVARLEYHEQ